jgi:hypothetical protein
MKKVSKPTVIARAFTGQNLVSEEIHQQRMSKCATCPFNSVNTEDKSILSKIKDLAKGDHCTICGCFIKEKTSQPTEYCAKRDIGEQPEWNSLVLETARKSDINIDNLSPQIMTIDLDEKKDVVVLDLGYLNTSAYVGGKYQGTFAFEMYCEANPILSIVRTSAGCGCTVPDHVKVSEGVFRIRTTLTTNIRGKVTLNKSMNVTYMQQVKEGNPPVSKTVRFEIRAKIV